MSSPLRKAQARAIAELGYVVDLIPRAATTEQVVRAIESHYGYRLDDLVARERTPHLHRTRQMFIFLIRQEVGLSLPAIGRLVGRDHTTVRHAIRVIDNYLDVAEPIATADYNELLKYIRNEIYQDYRQSTDACK